ncbi:MAG TPA: SDR family oxidoreductase [Polyangia bacterium]|jgi:NAD(P)-dependent dehydrogenase (short-subunit alcohol dehydrogenase family)|nr:SDR family oxidoreductase [Polyangia bacterium]
MPTAIITGASQGIGAGLVEGFLGQGYDVVATARDATRKSSPSSRLLLVDGDIGKPETAAEVVRTAIDRFGAVDVLVNNAGIFRAKPFTEYTADDFDALVSVNLRGLVQVTQLAVKQMLAQKSGAVVSISASLADHPIAGVDAAVAMMTKGGVNTMTRSLAIEYARAGLRFNAVAPGVVNTPLHQDEPKDAIRAQQPMGSFAEVRDVVDAVLYLSRARQVTGQVLYVDGGAHVGRW